MHILDSLADKLWMKDLKVACLAEFESIKYSDGFLKPGRFSLFAVITGSMIFTEENGNGVKVSSGSVYVIRGSAQIKPSLSPVRICLISFSKEFAISNTIVRFGVGYMNALSNQESFVLAISTAEMRHLVYLFALLKKKISSKQSVFKDEVVLLCINMILYEYVEMCYKYGKITRNLHYRNNEIALAFIKLVQQDAAQHHNVRYYADCLFVSSGHLGKAIRAVLGISAKQFIELTVMSEAYKLLADYQLSISEVSERLNFDSTAAFSGFFKKYAQMTPTQYRLILKI